MHTGLPFVFAAWVANKVLPYAFLEKFNTANEWGVTHIQEVIFENDYGYFNLKEYYIRYISFTLNNHKRNGLKLFLKKLENQ
jgi:chorismate dehydratase